MLLNNEIYENLMYVVKNFIKFNLIDNAMTKLQSEIILIIN